MKIALVNRLTNVPQLTPLLLANLARALYCQLVEASAKWGVVPPDGVFVAPPSEALDANTVEVGIWMDPDDPGAAGYHTVDPRGKPFGKVFWSVCDGILSGASMPLSGVLSHECLELWLNRFVNRYVLRNTGTTLDSCELCDAVEDVRYKDPHGSGAELSDYLLPAAFNQDPSGPYDRQGVLQSRYDTTPGGYRSTLQADLTDTGEMRLRCVAYFGDNHVMANADPTEVEAGRQRIKSLSVRTRHAVASVEWRRVGSDGGPGNGPVLARARTVLTARPAIPPPAPVPAVVEPGALGTLGLPRGSRNSRAGQARARGIATSTLNPTIRRVKASPTSTARRVANAPPVNRPVRFHAKEMERVGGQDPGVHTAPTVVPSGAPSTPAAAAGTPPNLVNATAAPRPAVPVLAKRRPIRGVPATLAGPAPVPNPTPKVPTPVTAGAPVAPPAPALRRTDTVPLPPVMTPPPPAPPVEPPAGGASPSALSEPPNARTTPTVPMPRATRPSNSPKGSP